MVIAKGLAMTDKEIFLATLGMVSGEIGERPLMEFGGLSCQPIRDRAVPGRQYSAGWPWEQRQGKSWQQTLEQMVELWEAEQSKLSACL